MREGFSEALVGGIVRLGIHDDGLLGLGGFGRVFDGRNIFSIF